MATIGLTRTRNGWQTQHSVRILYDNGDEHDIPQDYYESSGMQPPFEDLPWVGKPG